MDVVLVPIVVDRVAIGMGTAVITDNPDNPAVTAQQISAFVFATRIVHFLFYLNPKYQASSLFLWLHSLVCVGTCQKTKLLDAIPHIMSV